MAFPFFGIGMKTDIFQSCGHCWVFQVCWYIEWSTLTAPSFRIWNSSTGIPSPPLALFIIMLHKVHLISHSRISGSRWVIIPSWLSGSLRPILYNFPVYSCQIFLISSVYIRSILFLSFLCPSLHEMFPWCLSFSWRSLVFLILLFSSISLHCSPWYMGINSWSTLHRVVARKHKFWFWAARCRGDQLGEGTKVKIRTKTLFIYYKLVVKSLSRVRLFVIPWTVAHQVPPSMGFSRREYWSGLSFPSPGGLPHPGIEPGSPALQTDSLPSEPPGKSQTCRQEGKTGGRNVAFSPVLVSGSVSLMTQHKRCNPLTAKEPWMKVFWCFRDPGSLVVGVRKGLGVEKYWVENYLSQALCPQNELSGGAPEKCSSLNLHPLYWEASDWRHLGRE